MIVGPMNPIPSPLMAGGALTPAPSSPTIPCRTGEGPPPAVETPGGAAECGAGARRGRSRPRAVEGSLGGDDMVTGGGQVVAGGGPPGGVADVVIREGGVAAIDPGHVGPARRVIDAR